MFSFFGSVPKLLLQIVKAKKKDFQIFSFHFYVFSFGLQKSIRDTIHKVTNYSNLLPEMPRYCYLVEIFFVFLFMQIQMKFKTGCQNCQAGKSVFPKGAPEWRKRF